MIVDDDDDDDGDDEDDDDDGGGKTLNLAPHRPHLRFDNAAVEMTVNDVVDEEDAVDEVVEKLVNDDDDIDLSSDEKKVPSPGR